LWLKKNEDFNYAIDDHNISYSIIEIKFIKGIRVKWAQFR